MDKIIIFEITESIKDDFIENHGKPIWVIPTKVGIQELYQVRKLLDPGFHRGDKVLRDYH